MKKKEELTKIRVLSLATDTLAKDHQGEQTTREGNTIARSPKIARSIGTSLGASSFTTKLNLKTGKPSAEKNSPAKDVVKGSLTRNPTHPRNLHTNVNGTAPRVLPDVMSS